MPRAKNEDDDIFSFCGCFSKKRPNKTSAKFNTGQNQPTNYMGNPKISKYQNKPLIYYE